MGEMIDLAAAADAPMRAYKALPAQGSGPVVVVLHEIFGVNVAMRAVADDLAAQGYVAVAPELFWRLEPGVDLAYDDAGLARARDLWSRFDADQGVADVAAALAAARRLPECAGPVGVLGFCLGGQLAVQAGAAADAVVCFYGTQLARHLGAVEALTAPTLFHFGDADPHVGPEVRAAVIAAAADKPEMTVAVYPGAEHAFFNRFRPQGFDREAHDRAWPATLALFARALKPDAAQPAPETRELKQQTVGDAS